MFSILGNQYGGDGVTTFALPNLCNNVPLGAGQGPGLSYYAIGDMGGTASVTLTQSETPAHNHNLNVNSSAGTPPPILAQSSLAKMVVPAGRSNNPINWYLQNTAPTTALSVQTVLANGGNQAHNNMQPTMAMNYIICTSGLMPPRG